MKIAWHLSRTNLVALGLSAVMVFCASAYEVSAQQASSQGITYVEGEYGPVQAPTAERPYYLVNFDAEHARANPNIIPTTFENLHDDKIVIMNFVREGDQISDIQTQEIAQMFGKLAERSRHKDLMLVNVTVVDAAGEPVHAAAHQIYYENNTLVNGNTAKTQRILPYGAIYATSLTEPDVDFSKILDFSVLSNPTNQELVQSNAEFNGYVDGVKGLVVRIVDHYNDLYEQSAPKNGG